MKKIVLLILVVCFTFGIVSAEARNVRTSGYMRKNGTYVAPSYKTSPNKSKFDNYSTKGNSNPYSGRRGTVDPYKAPSYKIPSYKTPSYRSKY